jgi:ribosome maturation factor RimP
MAQLTLEEIGNKVRDISLPILAAANIELVELKVGGHAKDVMLEFMADRPTGGITFQECATLNRAIVDAIDADGFLGENYSLEFSSPGLDRPLVTTKDFLRNMKYEVRVILKTAVSEKREWTGQIIRVNTADVVLLTKQKKEIVVPLTVIEKAVLVI